MQIEAKQSALPTLLAGPVLRRVDANTVTVWLVTSVDTPMVLSLAGYDPTERSSSSPLAGSSQQRKLAIGERAFVQLLTFRLDAELTAGACCQYDIAMQIDDAQQQSILHDVSHLQYDQHPLHFYWQPNLTNVFHGSCRKPHYDGGDALVALDDVVAQSLTGKAQRPDLLLMTGDQVYTDDVAGPMLQAIHQVSDALGLFNEPLEGSLVTDSNGLKTHPASFYRRDELLPKVESNDGLVDTFFGAKKKPVFTSVHANNHLIGLNEMLAMYILVWSPTCWQLVSNNVDAIDPNYTDTFTTEQQAIDHFVAGLRNVQRVLAHLPVYMIFDDHDITDDWNLTRSWEEIVYGNPLSKRVIGNALVAYWICQGWGNEPDTFKAIHTQAEQVFQDGLDGLDEFNDTLLDWSKWHYQLNTSPTLYILDTRTQRWRSESDGNKPSGLMDWEALCEFQQSIIGHERVIVVSAAPIYGVKLIETIQRIFTFFGHALTVDAENWMAHKGTASVILNIFRHIKTPPQFIILSGDVHYSFVYDVSLKFRRNSPNIVQFTCSGMKNVFPDKLIRFFDWLNQVLYGSKSPLNWFTKRRTMKIKTRRPQGIADRTLINTCAVGQLVLSPENDKVVCQILKADGETVKFNLGKEE